MKGLELDHLPLASPIAAHQGWTLDTKLLDEIQDVIEIQGHDHLDWEEIESVLMALAYVDRKRRQEYNEKAVG